MVLSIIVPAFNAEDYICRCLDSILSQDLVDFEVLLVDDGSIDKTAFISQVYVQQDSRVKYFHQENQGVSLARNLGINSSCGDYLWFVDADDYISDNSLSTLISILISEDLDLLQFGWNIISSTDCKKRQIRGVRTDTFSGNDYVKLGYFLGTASRSLIKKSLVKGEIYFDKSFTIGEDSFFMTQVLSKCLRVRQIELAPYNYFQNSTSATYNLQFNGCIFVAKRMMDLELDKSFNDYKSNFMAFYLSLSFFCKDYNESQFLLFADSNVLIIDTLFAKKVVQNILSYRYGFFRIEANRQERLITLKRVCSFYSLVAPPKSLFFSGTLFFVPPAILDMVFLGLSKVLKVFYKFFK